MTDSSCEKLTNLSFLLNCQGMGLKKRKGELSKKKLLQQIYTYYYIGAIATWHSNLVDKLSSEVLEAFASSLWAEKKMIFHQSA